MDMSIEWSGTSGNIRLSNGGSWFTDIPEAEWPVSVELIRKDFEEPYGDRRQEIVVIWTVHTKSQQDVENLLDSALVTSSEPQDWMCVEDPLYYFDDDDDADDDDDDDDDE
jgi:hypothetical protein